jgi:hypothetical protein
MKIPAGTLANGQIQLNRVGRDAAPGAFRKFGEKVLPAPAPAHGMKRVTSPSHEFLHGQAVNDEAMQKTYEGTGNVPTHPGMVTQPVLDDKYRGSHNPQLGNAILAEAGRLGAPVGGYKK